MDITPLMDGAFLKLTRRSTDISPTATDLSFSILKRAPRYFGPLVLEGPARSTITSYNCRPFYVTDSTGSSPKEREQTRVTEGTVLQNSELTNMTGKKWICPSGFVWVSLK
jgi:hypothetical protein